MTTRRKLLFAGAAIAIAVLVTSAGLLAVDVYLHGRYEKSAGFNIWGYRGPSVGRKKPNEYRVVVVGGSSAYGYGVSADEAMPAVLQRMLRQRTGDPLFTVINLGYNNEAAYSFKPTLQDYKWLDYDLAIMYEGYNDLAAGSVVNVSVFRHDSPVFRMTGYMPIFPIIFKEKAGVMVSGGDPNALYDMARGKKTVFHASLATRVQAGVLTGTADIAQSLEQQLGRLSAEPEHRVDDRGDTGCLKPWGPYCQSVAAAIEYVRGNGGQVLVGTQPYLTEKRLVRETHMAQQAELRAMLARRFGADAAVGYVNLGDQIDLANAQLSFDHMHLTVAGNERLSEALVEPVLEMARRRQKQG